MGLFNISLGSLGILPGRTWGPDGPMRASRNDGHEDASKGTQFMDDEARLDGDLSDGTSTSTPM
jgi:hypothetical protein